MKSNLTQLLLQFSSAKLSLVFSPSALSIFLAVFFILYFIASAALWYHWSKYGMGRAEIAIVKTLFLFVSVVLFVLAILGISYL